MRAAELVLARVWPVRRGRPVSLPLPPIETASDVVKALGTVATAVGAGEITPEEGTAVAGVLEIKREGHRNLRAGGPHRGPGEGEEHMSARLFARLERLQPRRRDRMVIHQEPGESDMDVEIKVLTAGRPVMVAPRPGRTTEEWLLRYGPLGGNT